nr:integrin alpha-7-like isoform X1 [Camelus dromedarius]
MTAPFLAQTCAHRYELRQQVDQILETRDVIGRCFVLSQDLAIHDELDGGEWKFCEGRPQGHEQFGFCQQGTAAAFSPDSHYLLFGAPGTYNWKGTARVELCAQGSVDLAHLDDGPYEAGGEKEQDPRLIPVPANSYFGRDPSPAQSCSNPLFLSLSSSLSTLPSFCLCLCLSV